MMRCGVDVKVVNMAIIAVSRWLSSRNFAPKAIWEDSERGEDGAAANLFFSLVD